MLLLFMTGKIDPSLLRVHTNALAPGFVSSAPSNDDAPFDSGSLIANDAQ